MRIKKYGELMKKLLVIAITFLVTGNALAGNVTAKIASILVADDATAVLFTLTLPINGTPRCNEGERFSVDIRKPGGMAVFTAILEAKKQGYEVTVEGLNTCVNEWKSEDIMNVMLH